MTKAQFTDVREGVKGGDSEPPRKTARPQGCIPASAGTQPSGCSAGKSTGARGRASWPWPWSAQESADSPASMPGGKQAGHAPGTDRPTAGRHPPAVGLGSKTFLPADGGGLPSESPFAPALDNSCRLTTDSGIAGGDDSVGHDSLIPCFSRTCFQVSTFMLPDVGPGRGCLPFPSLRAGPRDAAAASRAGIRRRGQCRRRRPTVFASTGVGRRPAAPTISSGASISKGQEAAGGPARGGRRGRGQTPARESRPARADQGAPGERREQGRAPAKRPRRRAQGASEGFRRRRASGPWCACRA